MNLQSIELSFDYDHWAADDEFIFKDIPKKIVEWGDRHFLHRYEASLDREEYNITVFIYNVPESATSLILLSSPNVSIKKKTNYAPIASEVIPLFDFGDNL